MLIPELAAICRMCWTQNIQKICSNRFILKISRRRKYLYMVIIIVTILIVVHFFGIFDHLREKHFETEFIYPLDIDLLPLLNQVRNNATPTVSPINVYNYNYLTDYITPCKGYYNSSPYLVILIKSAVNNFNNRIAIRRTWGKKYQFPDKPLSTVFILGISTQDNKVHQMVMEESRIHKDIIQLEFIDSYYNSTIQVMSAFKWAYELCSEAKYYFFTDDDMYVSIKNIYRYVKDPKHYPDYIYNNLPMSPSKYTDGQEMLYAGYVFTSSPQRHISSKWYTSLEEYPWDRWPVYATGGSFLVSTETLKTLYAASLFVKHFKFDDIFLAIVAKKVGIKISHCDEFYFYRKPYKQNSYRFVIASHGFSDTSELKQFWNDQRLMGNA